MPLLDRKSPTLLAALATIGIGVSETQAAGPRDYDGPLDWSVDRETSPDAPPTGPTEAPPTEAPPTEAPPTPVEAPPAGPPPEEDTGCADDDFCVEDLTSDTEALKKEMATKAPPKLAGPAGTVTGRMRDATSGSPLIGVNVIVVGTTIKTKTDIDGNFILPVPPGTYQLRIWYDAYEGMTISGVVVGKDETVNVNRELKPIAGMTQTVAVTAEINKENCGACGYNCTTRVAAAGWPTEYVFCNGASGCLGYPRVSASTTCNAQCSARGWVCGTGLSRLTGKISPAVGKGTSRPCPAHSSASQAAGRDSVRASCSRSARRLCSWRSASRLAIRPGELSPAP